MLPDRGKEDFGVFICLTYVYDVHTKLTGKGFGGSLPKGPGFQTKPLSIRLSFDERQYLVTATLSASLYRLSEILSVATDGLWWVELSMTPDVSMVLSCQYICAADFMEESESDER